MKASSIGWLLIPVLLGSLVSGGEVVEEVAPQVPTMAQVLAKLMPLPDDVARTIKNPYHAHPAWKLWAIDPSPVTLDKPHFKGTFQPTSGVRKYPVFGLRRGMAEVLLEPLGNSDVAGFWDDCYMSLDLHHTRLGQPANQFIDGGKMETAQDVETLLQLGVNFTSQSYADRGRAIVDDVFNNFNTERYFFFANDIRATPAHASYRDQEQAQVNDIYDGLFAHSYHSLGQSGSEVHALYKMMLAGAAMPRSTKNLLKKHGAYAMALLTIFKAALPYADAQGRALPFEHELRHRPVYSSNGTPSHAHYCPANAHYHGYDEQRHLQGMLDLARELRSAPPVAIAKLLGLAVTKKGVRIIDPTVLSKHVKCLTLTNMRFWAWNDDLLELRIDLNQSYDLQDRKLLFKCQTLYPNQKNVSISEEAHGVFLLRVRHDPNLPKGRIPVICTATNGLAVPSNPIFINFYWPGENELDDYFSMRGLPEEQRQKFNALGLKRLPVTVNKRPVVDFDLVGDALRCQPGQTVTLDWQVRDPEGFPVTVYRRAGQNGSIENNRFTFTIPTTDRHKIYRQHFIFSDGTGGYTGKQIKLLVSPESDVLSEDWGVTALGSVERVVQVAQEQNIFTFGKQPLNRQSRPLEGTLVCQPIGQQVDLRCRIPEGAAATDMALLISNTLDGFSKRVGLGIFQGKVARAMITKERSPAAQQVFDDLLSVGKPEYFWLSRRGSRVAGYVSMDNQTWQQVMSFTMELFSACYGGLIYQGDPWTTGVCQWLPPTGPALPVFTTNTQAEDGKYHGLLKITVTASDQEQAADIHYTLDGSEPTAQSPVYEDSITLTQAGRNEIRIKVSSEKDFNQPTVMAIYHLQ